MAQFFYQIRRRLEQERPLLVLILLASCSVALWSATSGHRPFRGRSCAPTWRPSASRPAVDLPRYFVDWRKNFLDASREADRLGLVRGIFLGDDAFIPTNVRERFREAGLFHLLAASGFNCWVVAMAFGIAAKLLLHYVLPWVPSALALRARLWIAPLAGIAGAWLFWSWSDQAPPITRAAVMVSAKFLLEASGLSFCFGRLLLTQYLLSLLFVPRLWMSASFQLTFGCLFGVMLFPEWIRPLRARIPESLPLRRWLFLAWDSAAASIGGCLGAAPTTWLRFGEINFTGIFTNGISGPFVTFAVMPLGLVQMLALAPGTGWAGRAVARVAGTLAAWAAKALDTTLAVVMELIPSLRYFD